MKLYTPFLSAFIGIVLLFNPARVFSQKSNLEVSRCKSIDRNQAIKNLWIDESGTKWAANASGVYQIQSADLGTKLPFGSGEQSVLAFPYGNTDFRWNKDAMTAALGGEQEITTAYFDDAKKQLWIGTRNKGAYVLNTTPQLQVIDNFTASNTKLRSNYVTYIGKDRYDRFWIGTEEGVIIGTPGKWKDDLEGYAFQRMRSHNNDVYALADGELWIVEQGDKWKAIKIDEDALEGDPFDFDIADDGTLWILSRIAAKYDLSTDEFEVFSGTEYFTSEYGRFIGVDPDGAAWIATTDKGLFLIEEASAITLILQTEKELSCSGNGQDAVLSVKATGGKEPYQYAWSNLLVKGANPNAVPAGEHAVTVTDAAGKTKTAKTTVEDPKLTLIIEVKKAESAPGALDGRAEARISGGKPGYTFAWDNGEKTATALKLGEGDHSVTVTDTKGCSATAKTTISQKALPLNIELSLASPISCAGGTTTLIAATTGGKAPFAFNWNNAAMQGDKPDKLKAGTYNLTVTDALGNTARALFTIMEPQPVSGTILVEKPASTGNADGIAAVSAKGGNGNYTCKWDNGETTATANKLATGKHSVTITDQNGCTGVASVDISENIQPLQVVVEKTDFIKCHNGTTNLLTTTSGGKAPFTYKWNKPEVTSDKPANLSAGFYELTVTDATGKTATAGYNLQQPEPINTTTQVQAPASTGGSDGKATLTATGGNGNFTYKWDNGETTATATKLAPGKHSVTVTDAKGCTATASADITENILPLNVQIAETGTINCIGGTSGLSATVAGGKGPYQYAWSNNALKTDKPTGVTAGAYTLTVTDATGKTATGNITVKQPDALSTSMQVQAPASTGGSDGKAMLTATGGNGNFTYKWDNGETTATATKLAPGKHSVTVTDAKGCTATASADITENILPLNVQIAETGTINCNGGTSGLSASIAGGKGPYQYAWSNAALKADKPTTVPAGAYTLTITDAMGKTATGNITVKQPDALSATAQVSAPASTGGSDGKASITPTGGNGGFTYKWDNGETTAAATKLAPGKHSVTVTDTKGCTATASADISENILPLSVDVAETGKIKCAGETSALKVSVNGGKPPFTYKWDKNEWKKDQIDNVPAGTYAVLVTDAKGSTQSAVIIVKSPDAVKAEVTKKTGATTERTDDGKSVLTVKGGASPYKVDWDNGETQPEAKKLTLGLHRVTVTDATGCTASLTVDIGKRILPDLTPGVISAGQTVRIEQLRFDGDSSTIKTEFYPVLDEVYDFMLENGKIVIEVGGHTNNVPPDEYCDRLSTARAKAVADYLAGKGIDPKRVLFKGYGKRKPVASNTTPEGRVLNQRVEIKILSLGG
jgi:outer membrane protein OmpA-like peptidoglycan-associated protein